MKKFFIPPLMLLAGLSIGLLSAQYLMENATVASPVANSKWSEIKVGGDDLNATYLAGHFLRRGQVPPLKGARFFVRDSDDDGNSLRGDCLVSLEGKVPDARWWFVSAEGSGIRTALDAGEVVRESTGDISVSISETPAPGNWFLPPKSGSYSLALVLLDAAPEVTPNSLALPSVRRLWC